MESTRTWRRMPDEDRNFRNFVVNNVCKFKFLNISRELILFALWADAR